MTTQLIRVGHSPDPDDAFMFHALANDKIPTGNLRFVHELQDIETLNRRAMNGELEVSAVSIHAYSHLLDKYALLPSGCSMGDRYGPMVVAKKPLTVADLARQVHLSPSQFSERCRQHMGVSPMQWLRGQRLAQARALRLGGMGVAEAARRTGYRSPSALTAAMRRTT